MAAFSPLGKEGRTLRRHGQVAYTGWVGEDGALAWPSQQAAHTALQSGSVTSSCSTCLWAEAVTELLAGRCWALCARGLGLFATPGLCAWQTSQRRADEPEEGSLERRAWRGEPRAGRAAGPAFQSWCLSLTSLGNTRRLYFLKIGHSGHYDVIFKVPVSKENFKTGSTEVRVV